MRDWLPSLLMLNLAFSFQRLSVKPVEGSILGENLVTGVDKEVVTDWSEWWSKSCGMRYPSEFPCTQPAEVLRFHCALHTYAESWQSMTPSRMWAGGVVLWRGRCVDSDLCVRLRYGGIMEFIQLWQEAEVTGIYWREPWKGRWWVCVPPGVLSSKAWALRPAEN